MCDLHVDHFGTTGSDEAMLDLKLEFVALNPTMHEEPDALAFSMMARTSSSTLCMARTARVNNQQMAACTASSRVSILNSKLQLC